MNQYKTFYLVRHALATHSKYGYGKRKLTAGILPEGIPSIRKMADVLKKINDSANISSEIIRCRETSGIIAEISGKKFTFDTRLNEDNHETVNEIRKRVNSFLQEVSILPQTNIIICTHGKIIAAIKSLLLTHTFVTSQLYEYPQTGELVIIRGKTVETINFN